jgi:hypothetical protein
MISAFNQGKLKKMNKLTKQGVRDLDAVFGRAKVRKTELPPASFMCNHKNKIAKRRGVEICKDCGTVWEGGKLSTLG